jgi:hypothetical protein
VKVQWSNLHCLVNLGAKPIERPGEVPFAPPLSRGREENVTWLVPGVQIVAKLIDPTEPGDRQAAEDIEAVGYVVRKWREVLDGKTGKEIAST